MAGPTHVDDDRVITAGILRQNAQTSLKGASAICHRSDGAVSTRSAYVSLSAPSSSSTDASCASIATAFGSPVICVGLSKKGLHGIGSQDKKQQDRQPAIGR